MVKFNSITSAKLPETAGLEMDLKIQVLKGKARLAEVRRQLKLQRLQNAVSAVEAQVAAAEAACDEQLLIAASLKRTSVNKDTYTAPEVAVAHASMGGDNMGNGDYNYPTNSF